MKAIWIIGTIIVLIITLVVFYMLYAIPSNLLPIDHSTTSTSSFSSDPWHLRVSCGIKGC